LGVRPISYYISIAIIDETIQLSSPGRAFELSDLALDISGSVAGSMLILVICKMKEGSLK